MQRWLADIRGGVPVVELRWGVGDVGCAGEALVALLIGRGSTDDLTEAHRIVDHWQDRRPGIRALDLWWLKIAALPPCGPLWWAVSKR